MPPAGRDVVGRHRVAEERETARPLDVRVGAAASFDIPAKKVGWRT